MSAVDRGREGEAARWTQRPAVVEHDLEWQGGHWISWWEELVRSDVTGRRMPRGLFWKPCCIESIVFPLLCIYLEERLMESEVEQWWWWWTYTLLSRI